MSTEIDTSPITANTMQENKKLPWDRLRRSDIYYDIKVMNQFLETGVDLTEKDHNGNTIFHYMCGACGFVAPYHHHTLCEAVRLLLEYGANINEPNNLNKTPLYVACVLGKPNLVRVFLENGADPNIKIIFRKIPRCYYQKKYCGEVISDKNIIKSRNIIISAKIKEHNNISENQE